MRKRSKLSAIVVLSFFVLSLFPASLFAADAGFADMGSASWAVKYVDKLAELGVVNGKSATSFDPAGKVTRAEFAKMIVEAKGLAKENPATASFSDVASSDWFYGYVEAAAKAGYVNGMGGGKFAPNAYITREQIAKIIVEAAGLDADASKDLVFGDSGSIAAWAKGYVAVAVAEGFVNGYTDNTFKPAGNATRAEAAKLVYSEMVYDGKIVEVDENASELISDIKLKATGDADYKQYPLATMTIGGKKYDVDSEVEITLGGKAVNGFAVRKGTHAKATFNKDNDKVLSLELAVADYKVVGGTLEALGKEGTRTYVVFDDGTKVFYNASAENFSINQENDGDVELVYGHGVGSFPGFVVNTDYFVIIDETGAGYFWHEDQDADVEGTVSYVGEDATGDYLFINGQKYYALNGDLNDVDSMTTARWEGLAGKYVELTLAGGEVKIVKEKVSLRGYTNGKQWFVSYDAGETFDVYRKIMVEKQNNTYDGSYIWLHYESAKDYIDAEDVLENAKVSVYASKAAFDATNAVSGAVYEVDEYGDVSVNGKSQDLGDIYNGSYVILNWDDVDTDVIDSVVATTASPKGTVEEIIKDSEDRVIKVKIAGTTFDYVGISNVNKTKDEGTVYFSNSNSYKVIETGDFVTGVLDDQNQVVAFTNNFSSDANWNVIDGAEVVAKGGMASTLSSATGDQLIVPANTLEVKYTDGGIVKTSWISLGFQDKDSDRKLDDNEISNDKLDDTKQEELITVTWSGNKGFGFNNITVGSKIAFVTFAPGNTIPGGNTGVKADETNAPMTYYTGVLDNYLRNLSSDSFNGAKLIDAYYTYGSSTDLVGTKYYSVKADTYVSDTFTNGSRFEFRSVVPMFVTVDSLK